MILDLVIRGRVVRGGVISAAEVGVANGRIAVVAPAGTELAAAEVVQVGDDELLIPGLVDTHVHVDEPGRTEWEGFASATRAAAAGGVTTILDMPLNSIPAATSPAALAEKRRAAAGQLSVDVGFWGGAVPESLGRLKGLHDAGAFGVKCFLVPSGVPEFRHLSSAQLTAALRELAGFGGMLLVHAEDESSLHDHAGGPHYEDYLASRPPAAEVVAIERVIDAVRATGGRAHIVHLSSAEALPALRAARAEGLPITAETCPHYLSLDASDIPDGATAFKCSPPIRDAGNQDELWRALEDGTISFIVTDHSPSTAALKYAGDGDFAAAWGGISSLQVGLSAVWTEARARAIPIERVIGWMSTATADFAGLSDKGRIEVGADADLAIFAPEEHRTVRAAELLHRHPVTPYDGRELVGMVRRTWLRGGRAEAPRGVLLSRA